MYSSLPQHKLSPLSRYLQQEYIDRIKALMAKDATSLTFSDSDVVEASQKPAKAMEWPDTSQDSGQELHPFLGSISI